MQEDFHVATPNYPAINFLLRFGGYLSALVGLLPVLVATWVVANGGHVVMMLVGIGVGAFAYLIMRSYTELVDLIADMLLPK